MKKATIVIGSPRKTGSTRILAAEAERGLRERGADPETLFLNDLTFRGCQACYWCKKNDVAECAVKDDMEGVHRLIRDSEGFIVATPIYFGGVTAQIKAWLDRLFPYIGMDLRPKLTGSRPVSFIFTQNQPDPTLFTAQTGMFVRMVGLTGMVPKDTLVATDLDAGVKPPVTGRADLMDRAYRIGRDLLD